MNLLNKYLFNQQQERSDIVKKEKEAPYDDNLTGKWDHCPRCGTSSYHICKEDKEGNVSYVCAFCGARLVG